MDDTVLEIPESRRPLQVQHHKGQQSPYSYWMCCMYHFLPDKSENDYANKTQELVWMILSGMVADYLNNRALPIFVLSVFQLFGYIVFLVWSSNEAFIMAVYYITSAYGAIGPLISGWLNSSCGGNKQLRAITTALMISLG